MHADSSRFPNQPCRRPHQPDAASVVYAGAGVLSSPRAPVLIAQLAKIGNLPVCTSLQGLGAFDERPAHDRHARRRIREPRDVARGRDNRARHALRRPRHGALTAFAPAAHVAAEEGRGGIIHFEISPKKVNKVVHWAAVPVLGDVVRNMDALVPHIRGSKREGWFTEIAARKRRFPFTYTPSAPGARMNPQEVVEALDAQCRKRKTEIIIATGVGQHQTWAATLSVDTGGTRSRGLDDGLWAASCDWGQNRAPHKMVVDIDGDASFSMTAMELATAAQDGIGIKVLVLNNDFQGMVLQMQDDEPMTNPDFVALARAMGLQTLRCETAANLPAKMEEFSRPKPVLMECLVECNEHAFPMLLRNTNILNH
ncbi:thiamine diphosphate-binding protein [Mycena crocata]|nr:thiamine diphosphate-binding protein [Mycena crocata]